MTDQRQAKSGPSISGDVINGLRTDASKLIPACTPHASPSWQGVDGRSGYAQTEDDERVFVKISHADTDLFSAPHGRLAAARTAADSGIGPVVLAGDSTDLVVTEALESGWRPALLGDMRDLQFNLDVLNAKKRMHGAAPLPVTRTVFEHIEDLLLKLRSFGGYEPPELRWLFDNIGDAGQAITAAGYDCRPAHCDGTVSNVLVHDGGDIRLVDYDLACNTDPYEDFGSHFAEAFQFERDAIRCFEAFFGSMDEALFARVMIYGAADDLRWGLIGLLLNAVSDRKNVEFLKYAQWRLLRCRMAVRDLRFEEKVRLI